jgi:hypothetical protein
LIEPQDALHVTGMLAVNCCVCPCTVLAVAGVMVMGEVTFTPVEALPLPLVEVA